MWPLTHISRSPSLGTEFLFGFLVIHRQKDMLRVMVGWYIEPTAAEHSPLASGPLSLEAGCLGGCTKLTLEKAVLRG